MNSFLRKILAWVRGFKKHLTALLTLIILILVIRLFTYSISDPVNDAAYMRYFHSNYKIFGIELPKDLNPL